MNTLCHTKVTVQVTIQRIARYFFIFFFEVSGKYKQSFHRIDLSIKQSMGDRSSFIPSNSAPKISHPANFSFF